MYKLYRKINSTYQNPELYQTYKEAKDRASGEYMIIERKNGTDEVVEYGNIENKRKRKKDDWER